MTIVKYTQNVQFFLTKVYPQGKLFWQSLTNMWVEKYTILSPSRLLVSPEEKNLRNTYEGHRPGSEAHWKTNYRITEHFFFSQHITTTPTGLLYNRGLKWEELQGSDSMKKSLGEPKKRDKNKDTKGNWSLISLLLQQTQTNSSPDKHKTSH